VTGSYNSFPLCRFHFGHLNYQEEKAEAAGNPSWKEIWDDTTKDRKDDVESAVNYIIVLKGSIRDVPSEVRDTMVRHGLDKKYATYL